MNDQKPYVFISYAHANGNAVLSSINAMKSAGINLWFDEGIEAGSEWPEYIAEKVINCSKFVLFISKEYLESQNCKRELNFAISRKKEILSIYLENVSLSPGMEMQLGTYQAIFKNRFPSDSAFNSSLCRESFFNSCKFNASSGYTSFEAPKDTYTPPKNTYTPPKSTPKPQSTSDKNKFIAAILALFLGVFGVQYFYLGKKGKGILSLVFFWTYIPCFIGIFSAIRFFLMPQERFDELYNRR